MARQTRTPKPTRTVEALKHEEARRKNIPTAEHQSVMSAHDLGKVSVAFQRNVGGLDDEKKDRDRDLDPQLVWRGKDNQDWSELVVHAPPLYIQEKVHPKVLIDDLLRRSSLTFPAGQDVAPEQIDLFADFNGTPEGADKTDFYQHDHNWSNRMILGDSLQVMASLAEREGLRGKVQCIYLDPPYGIKFNSNFQWSTTSRDVKDGNAAHITREPEQVKAFRNTWRDGIHSYLTYLRDRLTVAHDLLADSGSIFVQIGDENVHRVRSAFLMRVFGAGNFISVITLQKTGGTSGKFLKSITDYVLFYGKDVEHTKYRPLFGEKKVGNESNPARRYDQIQIEPWRTRPLSREEKMGIVQPPADGRMFQLTDITSNTGGGTSSNMYVFRGMGYIPPYGRGWSTNETGRLRLDHASRVVSTGKRLMFRRFIDDFPAFTLNNVWSDAAITPDMSYVVQTHPTVITRCVLMATDPRRPRT